MRSMWLACVLGLSGWAFAGSTASSTLNSTPLPVVSMSNRVLPDIGFPYVLKAKKADASETASGFFGLPRSIRTAIGERGELRVFSVAEYLQLYPKDPTIQQLRQALLRKPTVPFAGVFPPVGDIPYLDLDAVPHDCPLIYTQNKILSFVGGQGIRYLGKCSFGVDPLNKFDFYYIYQGLSDNGAYYFSLRIPIEAKMLPKENSKDTNALFSGSDSKAMTAFISKQLQKVTLGSDKDFSPNLDTLDTLVNSIRLK